MAKAFTLAVAYSVSIIGNVQACGPATGSSKAVEFCVKKCDGEKCHDNCKDHCNDSCVCNEEKEPSKCKKNGGKKSTKWCKAKCDNRKRCHKKCKNWCGSKCECNMDNADCTDSATWNAGRADVFKGCQWVAKKPEQRCKKSGVDDAGTKHKATKACPISCGTCDEEERECNDVKDSFEYRNDPKATCEALQRSLAEYCMEQVLYKGEYIRADQICKVTCGNCHHSECEDQDDGFYLWDNCPECGCDYVSLDTYEWCRWDGYDKHGEPVPTHMVCKKSCGSCTGEFPDDARRLV